MHKDVLSVLHRDEAVALFGTEPLDRAACHRKPTSRGNQKPHLWAPLLKIAPKGKHRTPISHTCGQFKTKRHFFRESQLKESIRAQLNAYAKCDEHGYGNGRESGASHRR